MKRSEKLFLAINEIDGDIVEEAKPEEEKPICMKPEPRSPIKGIIALAACVAALAVGIFAIVKFKLNSDMDPIQNNSSEYSSDDNSYDNSTSDDNSFPNPDIELTFTEEDRELQAILKDLTANAEEIDRMFYKMSITDREPDINTHWYKYCLIPEDMRTEPNGLNPVPHSCAEMEELLLKYFSKRAVEFYMSEVDRASVSETANEYGENDISFENITSPIFAEINGKLYRLQLELEYNFSNLGIDCGTAKVTRQTDKTIEFTYWGYDSTKLSSEGGDTYSERNGAIVYEDGAWKLNYFYRSGFIPEMPNEYTEQDLELQAILETLKPGEAVQDLFRLNSVSASGDTYAFILPGDYEPEGSYQHYIDVSGPQPLVKHPKSIDELEDMLLEYFTEGSTAEFMSSVCKGTMTDNGDGTYTVSLDKDVFYPVYIEIDGKMFYRTITASGVGYNFNTAKVAEWTDDTIIFTYIATNPGCYSTETSALRFERGGWKRDPFYQS